MQASQTGNNPPLLSNLYPLGKLNAIIQDIAQTIIMSPSNIIQHWNNAANQDDIDSMHSIAILINHFKESQIYYALPQKEIKFNGLIKSGFFISHTFSKLTKNDNATNKKINTILIQIFSFFYTKFNGQQDIANFMDYLSGTIDAVEKLLLLIGTYGDQSVKSLIRYSEYQYALKSFQHFIGLFQKYEGNRQENQGQSQMDSQSESTFDYLSEQKILDVFMSTLIYIKIDFLLKKNQGINDSINSNETSLNRYLNVVLRQASKYTSNHRMLFTYLQPLLYFIPQALLRCKQNKEKQFVFEKLFMKSINLLNNMLSEQNKLYEQEYSIIRLNCQRDFVRAFRATNLLNDIEVALVGFEENQVKEHKGVEDYKEEYEQILQYFRKLNNVKSNLIKSVEEISDRFLEKWSEKDDLVQKINQISNQYRTGKQLNSNQKHSHQVQLSIFGNKKKQSKRNKKSKNMVEIEEQSEEDDQTIYDMDQSNQKIQENREIDELSRETFQGDDSGNTPTFDMFPLQNMCLNDSKPNKNVDDRKSNKSYQKRDMSRSQFSTQEETNKSMKPLIINTISLNYDAINIQVMDKRTFITYFNHHYYPYQSMELFREPKSSYVNSKINNMIDEFSGSLQVIYPDFINVSTYQSKVYSPLNPQRLSFDQSLKQKSLFKLNQQLSQKRLQNIQLSFLIYEKQNSLKKSGNSSKTMAALKKLLFQQQQLQKNIQKLNAEIRNQFHQYGKIFINLFPLAETVLGQITLQNFTQCLKIWMTLLNTKRKNGLLLNRSKKRRDNPFNEKILEIKNPYSVNIKALNYGEAMDYFFALVYDLMVVLFQSKKSNQLEYGLEEFYTLFFKKLDISHKAILLYYMYEIGRHQYYEFSALIRQLVYEVFDKKELVEILKFLILDLKLQCNQMSALYFNTYSIISDKCIITLKNVVDILTKDIIPRVKDITKNQKRNDFTESLKKLSKVKIKFYNQFKVLIDSLFMWMIVTYGVCHPSMTLNNPDTVKRISGSFLYYCPSCNALIFRINSPSNLYNHQESFCSNCSNSVLHRFEIENPSVQFINQSLKTKHEMAKLLQKSIQIINYKMQQNRWNVTEFTFKKYSQQQPFYEQQSKLNRTRTLSPQRLISSKQVLQQHQYCFNMERIVCQYLCHIFQLIDDN